MKVATIYDIHGNLPALNAVLAEIHEIQVDRIIVGGDVIPGPMPYETVKRLLELDIPVDFIMGNGDEEVLGQLQGKVSKTLPEKLQEIIQWVAQQFPPEYEAVLAKWSNTVTLEIEGIGTVLFCHATPLNNTDIFTRLTDENVLLPIFKDLDVSLVVCGHTHMQFERTIGQVRVMNAGSVGMPFGKTGADWLLLESGTQFQHTLYNLEVAADSIRKTNYPQAQDFADNNILNPPTELKALESLAKMGLK